NSASQMLITPEINDRPLFMNGKDWFGLEWVLDPAHPELMTFVKPGQPQFDDIRDWKKHIVFPSCKDLNWEMIGARTKAMWPKAGEIMGYTVANMGAFERLNSTMGYENGLMAMYDDPDAYCEYVNAYADYRIEQMEYIRRYMHADFLMMHDDWGNQSNMFFKPEMWRAIFKEPERRMAARAHELGLYYMHHSCGYIEPIVPDLVEIGVDSWHSVQPVNDLKRLKAALGTSLIFAGAVNPQVTDRPEATEEDIRAEVRRVIDTLGKGGGLLVSSAVMFSTSPGVDALIDDEGAKYGRYDSLIFD
ncbi:MAG: uroporphyrinogen decarboxylase family protein, partial [Clostridia bacterium]|nr:uroporphyrinogen decarboxylase family protein [Clostridia bacterium]